MIEVAEAVQGEFGNHQVVPTDLSYLTMHMQHRTVPHTYIDMYATQSITCSATSGSFVLGFDTVRCHITECLPLCFGSVL